MDRTAIETLAGNERLDAAVARVLTGFVTSTTADISVGVVFERYFHRRLRADLG